MTRPYYLFVSRPPDTLDWGVEFGDYERESCEFERNDWLEHLNHDGAKRLKHDTRVFRIDNASQACVNFAMMLMRLYDSHLPAKKLD